MATADALKRNGVPLVETCTRLRGTRELALKDDQGTRCTSARKPIAMLAALYCPPRSRQNRRQFVAGVHRNQRGDSMPYRLFRSGELRPREGIPSRSYGYTARWPWNDNEKQIAEGNSVVQRSGISKESGGAAGVRSCAAVSCREMWTTIGETWRNVETARCRRPDKKVQKTYTIDARRVRRGTSMGGYGTWALIADIPRCLPPRYRSAEEATRRRRMISWHFRSGRFTVCTIER